MLGVVKQTGTSPYSGAAHNETYQYDASGNTTYHDLGVNGRTQTFIWDAEGKPAEVLQKETGKADAKTTMVYNTDGSRLIRRTPGRVILYLPNQEINLPTGSTTATTTRYYTHGDQTVAMRTSTTDDGVTFLAGDHQGTTQIAVNARDNTQAAAKRYTPFGQQRDADGTWPAFMDKGFVGGTKDVTGLTHLGARDYDPNTGRFISVDPIFDGKDPQSWNGYAYADNGPVANSDSTGTICRKIAGEEECFGGPGGGGPGDFNGKGRGDDNNGTIGKKRRTQPILRFGGRIVFAKSWADYTNALLKAFDKTGEGLDSEFMQCTNGNAGDNPSFVCGSPKTILDGSSFAEDHLCDQPGISCGGGSGISAAIEAAGGDIFFGGRDGGLALAGGRRLDKRGFPTGINPHVWGEVNGLCNSFVPSTKVLMADGKYKPIEQVKTGDKVIATDPATGRTEAKTVTATITGTGSKQLVKITIDTDGPRGKKTGTITATDGHPFWVTSGPGTLTTTAGIGQWTKANHLIAGGWLRTSTGTYVQIKVLQTWTQVQTVHNLAVDDIHTYYVLAGATPTLAHNANCSISKGRWDHIWDRHVNRGEYPNKSKFFTTSKAKIQKMVNRALGGEARDGSYYYEFPSPIGRDSAGNDQYHIRVVVRGGKVITAFPSDGPE